MSDQRTFSLSTVTAEGVSRRGFLGFASATGMSVALAPFIGWAQDQPPVCQGKGPYDAMVLSCIDPRIIDPVHYYMDVINKQSCKYSQFVIAGAAVGSGSAEIRSLARGFLGEPGCVHLIAQNQEGDCH